jgi:small conductance mechanosensitive channel
MSPPLPDWVDQGRLLLGRLATGLALLLVFWLIARIVEQVVLRITVRLPEEPGLLTLLARSAKIALLLLGAITALGTVGVNVSALVAGLGLTGFALGFALRDILSNFLAGFLLLLYRPFGRGEHIAVSGLDGIVVAIDLRYTTLQREGKTILIPNSNLFTNPIVVSPAAPGAEPE